VSDQGRLSLVGTGIRAAGQITVETRHLLAAADRVLCLVDPLTLEIVSAINPTAESMQDCYRLGRSRDDSYAEMVERLLAPLPSGLHVCGVFYGHPGVFVWPAQQALREARALGYTATLYPGVSAEDCLVADLGFDPAVNGCQSYEASDFLVFARRIEPTALLVLWQPWALGDPGRTTFRTDPDWVQALVEVLMDDYPTDHPVIIYEAACFPLEEPRIESVRLDALPSRSFTQRSTLVLPPRGAPALCPRRLEKLGLSADSLPLARFQRDRSQGKR